MRIPLNRVIFWCKKSINYFQYFTVVFGQKMSIFVTALFGEGPPERRDRLRKLLSELGK